MIALSLALAFFSGLVAAGALRRRVTYGATRVWVVAGDQEAGLPTQLEIDVNGVTLRRLLEPRQGEEIMCCVEGAAKTAAQLAGWNDDPVWRRDP